MSEGRDEVCLGSGSMNWGELQSKVNAACHLDISLPQHSTASGFLATCKINGQMEIFLMCNNHVIETKEDAFHVKATFLFDDNSTPEVVHLDPDGLFITSEELDYTMIRVKEKDLNHLLKLKVSPIKLKKNKIYVKRGDNVHIPQHPYGKSKKYSTAPLADLGENMVWYKADTDAGSSGSPVFCLANHKLEILAMHKAGGSTSPNGTICNKGVLISSILEHVQGQQGGRNPVGRLSSRDESGMYVPDGNGVTNQGLPVTHPHTPPDSTDSPDKKDDKQNVSSVCHSMSRVSTQETPVPPQDPVKELPSCKKPFTSRELLKIAQRINKHWRKVAVFTGAFETWELDNIDSSNKDNVSKADRMLEDYKARSGTREALIKSLKELDLNEVVKGVRDGIWQ